MKLCDNELSFKPLLVGHFTLLHKWMQQPHLWPWWGEGKSWSFNDIKEKYSSYTLGYKIEQGVKKTIASFIIEFQGTPIGFIQFYNAFDFPRDGFDVQSMWNNKSETLAALDFYIGDPKFLGKGFGSKILQIFLQNHVFKQYDACLVDPEKSNKKALKAYFNAGFSIFQDLPLTTIMVAAKYEIPKNHGLADSF